MALMPYFVIGALMIAAFAWRVRWNLRVDADPLPSRRLAIIDALFPTLRGALLFAVLGPLAGYLTFAVLMIVKARSLEVLVNPGAQLVLLMFAYVLGVLPAIATGVMAAALRPLLSGWRGTLVIGALGLVATTLVFLHFGQALADATATPWAHWGNALKMGAMSGLPAGLLTGAVYLLRRRDE